MVDKEGFRTDFSKTEEKAISDAFAPGFGTGCVFFEKSICQRYRKQSNNCVFIYFTVSKEHIS